MQFAAELSVGLPLRLCEGAPFPCSALPLMGGLPFCPALPFMASCSMLLLLLLTAALPAVALPVVTQRGSIGEAVLVVVLCAPCSRHDKQIH